MAEENTTAPASGIGRRTIIIIAAAGLGSIFLVTGLILGILYFTGALSGNDEIIDRLNAIEGGSEGPALSSSSEDNPDAPQLLEIPDTNRLDTLYHQFAQVFVANVADSRKVMQMNLTVSTHYDQMVIDNVVKHELAVRAAILEHLSFVTEPETIAVSYTHLTLPTNREV